MKITTVTIQFVQWMMTMASKWSFKCCRVHTRLHLVHSGDPNKSFKIQYILSMRIVFAHTMSVADRVQPHSLRKLKLKTFQFPYRFHHVTVSIVSWHSSTHSTSINLWNRVQSVTTAAAYLPLSSQFLLKRTAKLLVVVSVVIVATTAATP